jgi:hypothetical protein
MREEVLTQMEAARQDPAAAGAAPGFRFQALQASALQKLHAIGAVLDALADALCSTPRTCSGSQHACMHAWGMCRGLLAAVATARRAS